MKKIFNNKIVTTFFIVLGMIGIFDFIVFPCLTTADTLVNILGIIVGFFTLVFGYYSLGVGEIFEKDLED